MPRTLACSSTDLRGTRAPGRAAAARSRSKTTSRGLQFAVPCGGVFPRLRPRLRGDEGVRDLLLLGAGTLPDLLRPPLSWRPTPPAGAPAAPAPAEAAIAVAPASASAAGLEPDAPAEAHLPVTSFCTKAGASGRCQQHATQGVAQALQRPRPVPPHSREAHSALAPPSKGHSRSAHAPHRSPIP